MGFLLTLQSELGTLNSELAQMRITFVAPFGLAPKGTTRYRALPLARALAARGHTLTLLIPHRDDPARAGSHYQDGGMAVRHLALPPRWPPIFHPVLALRLLVATRATRSDVVHVIS